MSEHNSVSYNHIMFAQDLQSLLDNYAYFEECVINDIVATVVTYFLEISPSINGERFEINNVTYLLKYTNFEDERRYVIAILIDDVQKKYELIPLVKEINQFGRIRTIEFKFPKSLLKHIKVLINKVADQIKYTYLSFERAFQDKFEQYENSIINNLYKRIELQLVVKDKAELQGEFWITLTKLSSRDKDLFLFFFDLNTIKSTISIIKNNQTNLYSPFEILECLLFEEAPDAGLEMFQQNINNVTIEFNRQLKFGRKNNKYLNAQKTLFDAPSFSFTYLCNTHDLLLALNYPTKYADEFRQVIEELQPDLVELFHENLNSRKVSFGLAPRKKITFSKIYSEAKDFIASVFAKTIKEMSEAA